MNTPLRLHRSVLFAATLVLASLHFLHAGPPLICHPYDIGHATSLPGGEGGLGTSPDYDRTALVRDTLALLTADMAVIVRMETLRRAVVYATDGLRGRDRNRGYTDSETKLARGLFRQLQERINVATEDGRALALFDAGFFAETLRQAGLPPGADGYELLLRAAALRPDDAEIKFALALAGLDQRRPEQTRHLAEARRAAQEGTLLAANLASHFGGR